MIDLFKGYKFLTNYTPPPTQYDYWTVRPRGPGYFVEDHIHILRAKFSDVSFPLGYVALIIEDTYDAESCYSSEEVDHR